MILIHFNMRSLPNKETKLESLLSLMPTLPDVVAITETKLNYLNKHLIDLENYQFTHVDSTPKAGGVGIYIRNDFKYSLKSNICVHSQDCESLFIEILRKSTKQTKKLVIGVVYRHPVSNYTAFQTEIGRVLQGLNHSNTSFILLEQASDIKSRNYLNDIYSARCYLLIDKLTRITSTLEKLLDHIYSNILHKPCLPGVGFIRNFSDIFP